MQTVAARTVVDPATSQWLLAKHFVMLVLAHVLVNVGARNVCTAAVQRATAYLHAGRIAFDVTL